jgi:uncharacterized protein YlxW (UPF0749 family)
MTAPMGSRAPDFLTELFRDPLDPAYAAAVRRRAARGPQRSWVRGTARGVSLLTVVLVGFLLAVAYRQVVAAEPESSRTRAGLVKEVRAREDVTDRLEQRAEALRTEVDRQRQAALAGDEATRLRNLAAAAGLGRVHGDGVVIEVADAPTAADPVTGAAGDNPGRVLDRDLQAVANALWNGGAEGIAINGERLSSTSTIRRAGAAILVGFKPVTSPYRVVAIGPDDLDKRFESSPAGELLRQLSRAYGMSVKVKRQGDITLPAAVDPQLRYARPPDEGSTSPSGSASPKSTPPSPAPSGGR